MENQEQNQYQLNEKEQEENHVLPNQQEGQGQEDTGIEEADYSELEPDPENPETEEKKDDDQYILEIDDDDPEDASDDHVEEAKPGDDDETGLTD